MSEVAYQYVKPPRLKYHVQVIRITAEDSPNVQRALRQLEAGQRPDGKVVVPGVLTWDLYLKRRKLWDKEKQSVGLDAQFYQGPEQLLFPPEWLTKCAEAARRLIGAKRICRGIGIDPAEGGDFTSMASVDEFGLIKLIKRKTPNTTDIPKLAKAFATAMNIGPDDSHLIFFDRGGGGKQAADRMKEEGWDGVRTVAFGERITLEPKYGKRLVPELREIKEEKYVYLNRRAEMYGMLSLSCDPDPNAGRPPYAIPIEYRNLHFELSRMPKKYDGEGRLYMLPKHRPDLNELEKGRRRLKTLVELIGHSPDDADALAIAHYAMRYKAPLVIGAAI